MLIDGHCHCGRITFTAEIDPASVTACHCTDCQAMSGSAFRVVVPAPIETFVLHGKPAEYVKVADSGNRRVQAFCADCGTPLYSSAPENPRHVILRTGCITQRARLAPKAQIFLRSSMPWLASLHDVPGSPEQQAFGRPPQ